MKKIGLLSQALIGVTGILVIFKVWMKVTMGICKCNNRLDGKTVIVTGANAGIGFETAKDLAKRGARLVMVCRDMKKAETARAIIVSESGNTDIILVHIDFTSLSSVRSCANQILDSVQRIDILLNNAGTVSDSFTTTKDGLDTLMSANYFGPFLFTNILLEVIKRSAPSRIINVSSETYRMAKLDLNALDLSNIKDSATIAYANSKLCNILFTNELAEKLKGTGVTVNSLTPGVVVTEILRNSPTWFRISWNAMSRLFLKNAKEGSQTSIYTCVSPDIADRTGEYFKDCKSTPLVTAEASDMKLARQLWDLSETAVNIKSIK